MKINDEKNLSDATQNEDVFPSQVFRPFTYYALTVSKKKKTF